jgi:hypothetical protein
VLFQRTTPSSAQHSVPFASPPSGNGSARAADNHHLASNSVGGVRGVSGQGDVAVNGGSGNGGAGARCRSSISIPAQQPAQAAGPSPIVQDPSPQVVFMSQASTQASADQRHSFPHQRSSPAAQPSPAAAVPPPETAALACAAEPLAAVAAPDQQTQQQQQQHPEAPAAQQSMAAADQPQAGTKVIRLQYRHVHASVQSG